MASVTRRTPVWRDVDAQLFRERIVPANRPAVLKGLVAHWPAVRAGLGSAGELARYIARFAGDATTSVIAAEPKTKGRFFYTEDLQGFNYSRGSRQIVEVLAELLRQMDRREPIAMAAQHVKIPERLPGFEIENSIDLPGPSIPGLWVGNQSVVAAHFDLYENIACVVGGHRRFTLFPPDQVRNLYIGPIELTPAGVPISLVDLDAPDLTRFPRFEQALAAAEVAELEPGDAIYIPYLWWHHVRALDRFNVLVNYWWSDAKSQLASPLELLMMGLVAMRDLPPSYREAWRGLFDHWVFQAHGDPAEHMPRDRRGALGETTPDVRQFVRERLLRSLGEARP